MNNVFAELKAEAERLEWDALYTMKGHFNSAMLWNITHYSLGVLAVLLGALAGKQFFDDLNVLGSTIAATSAALTAVITFLKPSEKAQPHHEAGVSCAEIKRQARMFQNIAVILEMDGHVLKQQLDVMIDAYHRMQNNAPPVPWLAYQITRIGVRKGEHTYNEEGEKK